jgi:CubicO group peptidase (beta-lactamase class C family)
MSDTPLHGTVESGFEPVREAFARSFEKSELGAAVCAYVDGRKVVDLWGGWADAARTREWQRDTIACTYSATKLMTATCAHRLVDRGLLDLDEPVATYWPEFAQAGKKDITVRMVLSHQAGLPWVTVPYPRERFLDWATLTDALARSSPVWEPGTRSEYHGGTFGYLVGEVVKRIDGRSLGTFFREEIAAPLGVDFMIEFGPEHDARCAEMVGSADMVGGANTRRWRAAGDGSATGHGSAESLARVCAALARRGELDGVPVLRAETIEAAAQEQPLLRAEGTPGDFGLGYQLLWKTFPGLGKQTFGHTGMGGSIGLANPTRRLGFGYVMNQMGSGGANDLLIATYTATRSQRLSRP